MYKAVKEKETPEAEDENGPRDAAVNVAAQWDGKGIGGGSAFVL